MRLTSVNMLAPNVSSYNLPYRSVEPLYSNTHFAASNHSPVKAKINRRKSLLREVIVSSALMGTSLGGLYIGAESYSYATGEKSPKQTQKITLNKAIGATGMLGSLAVTMTSLVLLIRRSKNKHN